MAAPIQFVRVRVAARKSVSSTHSLTWMLVDKWVIKRVKELEDLIKQKFHLAPCNNLNLFIDGALLPPSESTEILHDSDIISVRFSEETTCNLENGRESLLHPDDNHDNSSQDNQNVQIMVGEDAGVNPHVTKDDARKHKSHRKKRKHKIKDDEREYHTNDTNLCPEHAESQNYTSGEVSVTSTKSKKKRKSDKISKDSDKRSHSNGHPELETHIESPETKKRKHDLLTVDIAETKRCTSKVFLENEKSKESRLEESVVNSDASLSGQTVENKTKQSADTEAAVDSFQQSSDQTVTLKEATSHTDERSQKSEDQDNPSKPKRKRKRRRKQQVKEGLPIAEPAPPPQSIQYNPPNVSLCKKKIVFNSDGEETKENLEDEVPSEEINHMRKSDESADLGLNGSTLMHGSSFLHNRSRKKTDAVSHQSYKNSPPFTQQRKNDSFLQQKSQQGFQVYNRKQRRQAIQQQCAGNTENEEPTNTNLKNGDLSTAENVSEQPKKQEPVVKETVNRDYLSYSLLQGPPRTGDTIAFKVLEMSHDYTPAVSNYKEGKVIRFDAVSQMIDVQLTGKISEKMPGRFDLRVEYEEEILTNTETPADNVISHEWSSLIDPRLISE